MALTASVLLLGQVSYGTGLVMLFWGESGTGKTMTANAVANHLHKRLLVITVSTVGRLDADTFKFIFREAKIQGEHVLRGSVMLVCVCVCVCVCVFVCVCVHALLNALVRGVQKR